MSYTITGTALIERVRNEADVQTADEANSVATNTEILQWLNRKYRELYEAVCDEGAGPAHFGTRNAAFASPWALASTVFRVVALDITVDGQVRTAIPFTLSERNDYDDPQTPRWQEYGGSVIWRPSDPTGTVTLWYIPAPTDFVGATAVEVWNGWDDYLVRGAVMQVRLKQEYDVRADLALAGDQLQRIRHQARKRRMTSDTLADVRKSPDRFYFNG